MSNPTHPQPAFDLLLSLAPDDKPVGDTIFTDWYAFIDGANRGDNIREHPELWNTLELPELFDELTESTSIAYAEVGRVNTNGLAIGLGLEDVTYEPEDFPGVIYKSSHPDTTVLIFVNGSVIGFAPDQSDSIAGVEATITRIKELDLDESSTEDPDISTYTVAELIDESE